MGDLPPLFVMRESNYESSATKRFVVERGDYSVSQLRRGDFPPRPLLARNHLGSEAVDFIDTGTCIVSNRFRMAIERGGLSGAVFAPLGGDGDGLWALGITGRCGAFDFGASERFDRIKRRVDGGEWRETYVRGFTIDSTRWSRDDFALPPVANFALATARARETLEAARLTNVEFVPICEFEISERNLVGASASS